MENGSSDGLRPSEECGLCSATRSSLPFLWKRSWVTAGVEIRTLRKRGKVPHLRLGKAKTGTFPWIIGGTSCFLSGDGCVGNFGLPKGVKDLWVQGLDVIIEGLWMMDSSALENPEASRFSELASSL